jgi:phosphopantetheinyl transferase
MKTGTHNPKFQEDYTKTTWTDEQHEEYLMSIHKKDFFALLKMYTHLSNWDEEIETEMFVSDNLGKDIYIMFIPTFNVSHSNNYLTGVPETDKEETVIELWDVHYMVSYSDERVLEYDDFSKTELQEIRELIKPHCQ